MLNNLAIFFIIIALSPIWGFNAHEIEYSGFAQIEQSRTEKLATLDSLISLNKKTNIDAFIQYSIEYVKLAQELDFIESAAKKAIDLQRPLTNFRNDPLNAITVINSVLARKYKINDSLLLGGLYLKRGMANTQVDANKAISDYNKAFLNFSYCDSLSIAETHYYRGQAYSSLGKFILAGEDLHKAYSIFESQKKYDCMITARQGIINMFSRNGFYEKAKTERNALIEKIRKLKLNSFLSQEYYNQAIDYHKMGDKNAEFKSLLLAVENFDNEKSNKTVFINIHSSLVNYYCERFQIKEANIHLNLLENIKLDILEDQVTKINYLGAKAKFLQTTGYYEEAEKFAVQCLEIAQSINSEDDIMNSYKFLSEIYFDMKEYRKSIESNRAASLIKDSIYNRSTANALAYYLSLYETEKKEKELIEKNTNISLLEKDNEIFKKVMVFGGIALILAFGVVILYRNQIHLRSNKDLQEKFSQELLISQEKERRRISKDLHDGIGQQLLLIKNKLIKKGTPEVKEMVNHTIEEVRSISRDLHPFHLQELGVTKAIENTIRQIDENTSLFISSEIDNIDNLFTKEEEVNIYRIVQESLSNIIKHANAEAGKVSIKILSNNILISIRDNGVGFDFTDKYQDLKSLGLKTLLERTKFLKGQMKVTSKKDFGTLLEFQLPL